MDPGRRGVLDTPLEPVIRLAEGETRSRYDSQTRRGRSVHPLGAEM